MQVEPTANGCRVIDESGHILKSFRGGDARIQADEWIERNSPPPEEHLSEREAASLGNYPFWDEEEYEV